MVSVPGNREIAGGGALFLVLLLYFVFDVECALLLGCFYTFPSWLGTFDAVFVALLLLVVAMMMIGVGALRRARSRLPPHIV